MPFFPMTLEIRTDCIFLKNFKKHINKQVNKGEYVTEILGGPQSLKYLLSDPLQKKCANLWFRSLTFYVIIILLI